MRTPDDPLTRSASSASSMAAISSELPWNEGDGMVLADVAVQRGERAGSCRGRRIDGQHRESDRRREQGARLLPADGRGGRAGEELEDVAETDQIADQETLDEQQPRTDANHRRHLVANDRAHADADRCPQSAGEAARRGLHRDHSAAPGGHEEGRADRPVSDLARYRERAQEGGEQYAQELPPSEHRQLMLATGERFGGEQAVQHHGQHDQADQGTEQAEPGPGRAELGAHGAALVRSRKTSSSVAPRSVSSSSRPVATRRPRSMITTWSTVCAASASM